VVLVTTNTTRAKCPYCSAEFDIFTGQVFATCPYCGTTFKVSEPTASIEHYVFTLKYDSNKAFEVARYFISIQPGVPSDASKNINYSSGRLYYVPIYVYEIVIDAPCIETEEVYSGEHFEASVLGGQEAVYKLTPGSMDIPIPIPRDYQFPAQVREYFKPRFMREAFYIQPTIDPYEQLREIKEPYLKKSREEAEMACPGRYKVVDKSSFKAIAHYPFWMIEYTYRGGKYRVLVDGSDGTVVYAEYPLDPMKKTRWLLIGVASTLIALGTSQLIINVAKLSTVNPWLYSILSYIGGIWVFLSRFLKKKGVYMFNPREEGVFSPPR
jgi:uncharacterized Zn-finger protein